MQDPQRSGENRIAGTGLQWILFSAMTAFFLLVFHGQAYTIDILYFWQLHLVKFSDIFAFCLHYGNGRILGNIFNLYLINYPVPGLFVRAVTLAGLPLLLCRALRMKYKCSKIFACILILLVSPATFGQCYGWICGFQNYVPGIVLFLLATVLVCDRRTPRKLINLLRFAAILVLGVNSQLYVEHSSVYQFCCTLILLVIALRTKKNVPEALVFFVASAVGSLAMILIPHYYTIGSEVSGYRSTYFSSGLSGFLFGMVKNGTKLIGMFTENAAPLFLVSFLLSRLLQPFSDRIGKHGSKLLSAGMLIPSGCFLVLRTMELSPFYGRLAVAETAALTILFIIYAVSGSISLFLLNKLMPGVRVKQTLILFLMTHVSLVPLLFVEPIPARCLLHSYLFLCGATLTLLEAVRESRLLSVDSFLQRMPKYAAAFLFVIMFSQILLFSDVRRMGKIREQYIAEQGARQAETVDYFMIPSEYVYDYWDEYHYRSYYAERYGSEMEVHLLPADQWFRDHYYHY